MGPGCLLTVLLATALTLTSAGRKPFCKPYHPPSKSAKGALPPCDLNVGAGVGQSGVSGGGGGVSTGGSASGSVKSACTTVLPGGTVQDTGAANAGVRGGGATSGGGGFQSTGNAEGGVNDQGGSRIITTSTDGKGVSTGNAATDIQAGANAAGQRIVTHRGIKYIKTKHCVLPIFHTGTSQGQGSASSSVQGATSGDGFFSGDHSSKANITLPPPLPPTLTPPKIHKFPKVG